MISSAAVPELTATACCVPWRVRERGLELGADRTERELAGGERVVDPREDRGPVFGRKKDSGRGHAHGQRI